MSAGSARAFCVRMMSDEDFRTKLANVKSPAEIDAVIKAEEYDFQKAELEKVVGEMMGKKLAPGELDQLVYGFYEEQADNKEACAVVGEWIKTLA